MVEGKTYSGAYAWIHFLGVLFLLMGLYGAVRFIHIKMRSVPYPIRGVYPSVLMLSGTGGSGYSRESECEQYPQVYYDYDTNGKQTPRPPTPEESAVSEEQAKRCVRGFDEDRSKQEQYDKNQTAFLLFVGVGLLFSRKSLN